MIFDPRRRSQHVQLLNDNTTMTAADEDSGGVALGSVLLSGKGVYYWEVLLQHSSHHGHCHVTLP